MLKTVKSLGYVCKGFMIGNFVLVSWDNRQGLLVVFNKRVAK